MNVRETGEQCVVILTIVKGTVTTGVYHHQLTIVIEMIIETVTEMTIEEIRTTIQEVRLSCIHLTTAVRAAHHALIIIDRGVLLQVTEDYHHPLMIGEFCSLCSC
jgi:hypothetical protein